MIKIWALLLPLVCVGCGTYRLGHVTAMPPDKTLDQVKIDALVCKDKARTEAESTGNQAAAFFLGASVIGAPVAIQRDRDLQRSIWQECMRSDGYGIAPPTKAEE